jgi:hypothetical protein
MFKGESKPMRETYSGPVRPGNRPSKGPTARRKAIKQQIHNLRWRSNIGACALLLALSGCTVSTTRYGWPGSYAPAGVPSAQDCVPFGFGQPTKFACSGGKVYTSHQLKDLREKAEKASKGTVASVGY